MGGGSTILNIYRQNDKMQHLYRHCKPSENLQLSVTEQELIDACKRNDRRAQKLLYERYAPLMLGVCRRYIRNPIEAEAAMVEGFFKALTRIDSFSGEGSFEGWIRRIMVNESLMQLRRNNPFRDSVEINPNLDYQEDPTVLDTLAADEILNLLNELPPGYRTVFNLYVVEGYKHREIAEELGISINTSKSQLILARQRMEELVKKRLRR